MRINGSLALEENEISKTTLTPETNYPTDPSIGRLIMIDNRLMVCTDVVDGIPVWSSMTQQISMEVHSQSTESTTWTFDHNFNSTAMVVQVTDTNGLVIQPDDVQITATQVVITLPTALAGKAALVSGALFGEAGPTIAFEVDFTNQSTIVVNHGLGREPIVRVYIDGREVQPATITYNTLDQVTLTFSTAQSGTVRCI